MPLSDDEIKAFVAGMEKKPKGPPFDPKWKITKTLLELVRAQAAQIIVLERALRASGAAEEAAIASIVSGLRGGLETRVQGGNLTKEQVDKAVGDLNQAIAAAQSGQDVARYAASILGFVAKILI